jgi:alcohol dehydrogenase (cytochrome c)
MIRRNYQAWSYSPLAQINTSNVKQLQLVWSWAMNESSTNEPTPIVHNGILYLANTGNIVQALDAATGELIWENRVGPDFSSGHGAIRSLGIYQDKIFLSATDARMVALDAHGQSLWDTRYADTAKGYNILAGRYCSRQGHQGMSRCDRYKDTGCYINAFDANPASCFGSSTDSRVRTPAATPGKLPNLLRAGGDPGSPAATIRARPDILGRGAGQAVDARDPWHLGQGAVH